jgi:phosphopantetheine adenylyltransferase/dephospho-CoA kinase
MFIQLLVVSIETYKGGLKVNEVRRQNNLSTLDIHTVGLLEAVPEHTHETGGGGGGREGEKEEEEEEKISSSSCRMKLLGMRLRVPEVLFAYDGIVQVRMFYF